MSEGDPKTSSIVDAQKAHANLNSHSEIHTAKRNDCLLSLLDLDMGSFDSMYALISSAEGRDSRPLFIVAVSPYPILPLSSYSSPKIVS